MKLVSSLFLNVQLFYRRKLIFLKRSIFCLMLKYLLIPFNLFSPMTFPFDKFENRQLIKCPFEFNFRNKRNIFLETIMKIAFLFLLLQESISLMSFFRDTAPKLTNEYRSITDAQPFTFGYPSQIIIRANTGLSLLENPQC